MAGATLGGSLVLEYVLWLALESTPRRSSCLRLRPGWQFLPSRAALTLYFLLSLRTSFMALERGTRLGPYVIDAPIGAGGMGEVNKAGDTMTLPP